MLQLICLRNVQEGNTTNVHLHALLSEFTDTSTKAVNVRPYRCSHYPKNEIKKLVKEMLKSGIVQLSKSPCSSPVLMVRKSDGSWRMCVDYRHGFKFRCRSSCRLGPGRVHTDRAGQCRPWRTSTAAPVLKSVKKNL